jgi:hypothetical protein
MQVRKERVIMILWFGVGIVISLLLLRTFFKSAMGEAGCAVSVGSLLVLGLLTLTAWVMG